MEYYGGYENPVSPPTHQQQYFYSNSPQPQQSASSSAAPNAGQPQFLAADQESAAGISLDFLDFESAGAENTVSVGSDGNPEYNMAAIPSLGHGVGHSVGIDLGFGMAVDFQHDWSENANYDMLEGYFFGGSVGNPPGDGSV
jgi:hypothetical protein